METNNDSAKWFKMITMFKKSSPISYAYAYDNHKKSQKNHKKIIKNHKRINIHKKSEKMSQINIIKLTN